MGSWRANSRSRGPTLGLAAAAMLAIAGSGMAFPSKAAAGVSSFPTGRYIPGPPHLAGSKIVWVETRSPRSYRVRQRAAGVTTTIRTGRARSNLLISAALRTSDRTTLIYELEQYPLSLPGQGGAVAGSALHAAMDGRPFQSLGGGCFVVGAQLCSSISAELDGSRAIYPASGQDSFRAVIRDLASSSPGIELQGVGAPVAIAGPTSAWVTPNGREVVVYDWVDRRERYRVPFPADGGLGGSEDRFGALDVAANGTAAFTYPYYRGRQFAGARYAWASVSEPYIHRMPIPVSTGGGARLRNGSIFFAQPVSENAQASPYRLYLAPLGGRARPLVTGAQDGGDFDGSTVTWTERTCRGARIASAPVSELLASPVRRSRTCRLRVKPLRANRRGQLPITPVCTGFSRKCEIWLLSLRLAKTYKLGRKKIRAGTRLARITVENDGPQPRPVLQLSRQARRLLAKRALRVRLRAIVSGVTATGSGVGAPEARKGTFVLRSRSLPR